ncbi:MAG: hypothetical protein AB2556_09415 [Candidatus Thiodiazotropha sp.]
MFNILKKKTLPNRTTSEIKQICNILFIDDRKFGVVDILKKSGWVNTKRLGDIESLDDKEIERSHILFVDILGVGKQLQFADEGLGLILALKEKYPWKKVVVYSAEPTGDRFHDALSKADARLRKDADPYQFQTIVENFASELFSLPDTIERVRILLAEETGIKPSSTEVTKAMTKIYRKQEYTEPSISKVFNIQNAGSIATIIQLFLTASK